MENSLPFSPILNLVVAVTYILWKHVEHFYRVYYDYCDNALGNKNAPYS